MDIYKYDVYRGPNIGVYAAANDEVVILPMGYAAPRGERLAQYLDVRVVYASVAGTRLIGTLAALNNHGMLLPVTATEDECLYMRKETGLNVEFLDSRYTALGNLICANDRGAVVSPEMPAEAVRRIADVLDVEAVTGRAAGYPQVGSMAVANMQGGIVHPETDEGDMARLSDVLGVEMEQATINGGVPFVSSGILLNNRAAVTGSFTSGPEIMMLTRAFGA